ncbi:MAG TPA: hypothetical protein VFI42_12330 [Thermomicrobiaceae bacterium]|nr:hypothetical protein [Thermomicrobiaceae bacterium]
MLNWLFAIGVWLLLALLVALGRVLGNDRRGYKPPPKSMGQKLNETEFLERSMHHW